MRNKASMWRCTENCSLSKSSVFHSPLISVHVIEGLSLHCVYTEAVVYSFKMVCWRSAQALCSAGRHPEHCTLISSLQSTTFYEVGPFFHAFSIKETEVVGLELRSIWKGTIGGEKETRGERKRRNVKETAKITSRMYRGSPDQHSDRLSWENYNISGKLLLRVQVGNNKSFRREDNNAFLPTSQRLE